MSTVTSMATRYWTFYRRTAFVVDSTTLAATIAVSRNLDSAAHIDLVVTLDTGGSINATITIVGTDSAGSSTTEAIAFTGAGARSSTKRWSSITELQVSGSYTGATIKARATSADGTANLIRYVAASSRPIAFAFAGAAKYPALNQGSHELDQGTVLIDYEEVWTPRVGDIAIDDQNNEEWEIRGVRQQILGFGVRPHHYRLHATILDS